MSLVIIKDVSFLHRETKTQISLLIRVASSSVPELSAAEMMVILTWFGDKGMFGWGELEPFKAPIEIKY